MKKVIYIEIDEDVAAVHDRLRHLKQTVIYLVVPKKSLLFQSLVNLKLLKSKLEALGKKLVLVTTDPQGRHLAKQLGILVTGRVEVQKKEAVAEADEESPSRPIQARRNEVARDQPKRFTEKKLTIAELVQEFRKKSGKDGGDNSLASLSLMRPNRRFLTLILVVSVGLFALISYIALPGAVIEIRPTFDNVDHTVNITLADKRKNQNLLRQNQPHVIASETVGTVTKQTKVFNTTSQEFRGENARGRITVINMSDEPWELKAGTRFQTEDGLIFRSRDSINVPAAAPDEATGLIPGKWVAVVIADPFDTLGKPVGERGNIAPARFSIPGLTKNNQRRVWGESSEPMTGGVTDYRKVVLAEDIEAAKKQIRDNLILTAKDELRAYIDSKNKLDNTRLVLLDDRRYVKTELLDLRISEGLEGSAQDKFEVFAKIRAEGVAYDEDQLFGLLKKEIRDRVHPDRQIREDSVTPETIAYEVIDEDAVSGLIKMTATIKGIEEYIVDPGNEAGNKLGEKIKGKVLGLKVDEAEKLLGNFPEVDAVSIKISPFWLTRLPRIPENIRIRRMGAD